MRPFRITALVVAISFGIAVSAFGGPALTFQKIYTDGKNVLLTRQVPTGESKEHKFTVKVPIQTKSGTQYREEQRIAMQRVTKEERYPATRDHHFTTIDGKEIPKEKLISQIPEAGKPVISLTGKVPLPAEWKELLRKDVVIMRFDPPQFDDEQE